MRDYVAWHGEYDDPDSPLSWRLQVVRSRIAQVLGAATEPVRVLSVCSGDGRDVLGVLDADVASSPVHVTLLEIDPTLAARARAAADRLPDGVTVEVRQADAGDPGSYTDAVPADLVLLVGIFGNVSDSDIMRTVAAAPALCRPGATLLWSRRGDDPQLIERIRSACDAGGFTETGFDVLDRGFAPGVGAVRFDGTTVALPAEQLFTFVN